MTTAQNDFWSGVENVFVELGLRPAKPTPAKIVSGPCQARGSQGASSGDRRGESEVSSKSWVRFLKCCLQFARARGHCHQLLLQTASPHHKHNHCIQAQKLQEQLGAQPASHVHEESMSNVCLRKRFANWPLLLQTLHVLLAFLSLLPNHAWSQWHISASGSSCFLWACVSQCCRHVMYCTPRR